MKARDEGGRKVDLTDYSGQAVAVMGDSSFFHSGIQALINAVYNKTNITFILFDNNVTGQTGKQPNPGTGHNIHGAKAPEIQLEEIIKACKVNSVQVVNAHRVNKAANIILSLLRKPGVNVLILRAPCPDSCEL